MRGIIIYFMFILTIQVSFGQVGTIQDSDGWTNVRAEPNAQSEIISKIYEGEVFWFDPGFSGWINVQVPVDSLCSDGTNGEFITGFIHKSRLLKLDSSNEYTGPDFEFKYFISKFDSDGKNIAYDDGKWAKAINGKHIWGTDGGLPSTEVDSIVVKQNGVRTTLDASLYSDLFNVTETIKIYKVKDLFIVYNENSDGAGFYEIAWVFDKDGLRQRLVGSLY